MARRHPERVLRGKARELRPVLKSKREVTEPRPVSDLLEGLVPPGHSEGSRPPGWEAEGGGWMPDTRDSTRGGQAWPH